MYKMQNQALVTRLIQMSAYGHDKHSDECARAISDAEGRCFNAWRHSDEFCKEVRAYLAMERKTGDALFDLYKKMDALERCFKD